MVRFKELERLGVALAVMTDITDGDCGMRGSDSETCRESLAADSAGNRMRVCAACGIRPEDLVCGMQVHGTQIAVAGEADRGRGFRKGLLAFPGTDGLITLVKNLPLALFVADCVPVFIADPISGSVGLVHAGREGTLHGIAALAIQRMMQIPGTQPRTFHALIGPSAGPCCYEVDPLRAKEFAAAGLPVRGRYLDLWQANAIQLAGAGVPASNIMVSGVCTICSGRYHSHRRTADGSRNMALISA
ncbi:MAG TPA: polyphenol oxidase family protein [Candidatus Hydrogenedentes bacterium]|nr:polyphenol oxidase family protein [Candidatus Hydrogenedentota bacterium]HOV72460.1 polyphenol oxidase family protein [Candidatus Hydrogenedentota bacterium]